MRIFSALALQFGHIVYPSELNPAYYWEHSKALYIAVIGVLIALLWMAAMMVTWRSRHPSGWPLTFAAICYLPASGIEYLPRFLADTYIYLPLIGLLAAVTVLIPRVKLRQRPYF